MNFSKLHRELTWWLVWAAIRKKNACIQLIQFCSSKLEPWKDLVDIVERPIGNVIVDGFVKSVLKCAFDGKPLMILILGWSPGEHLCHICRWPMVVVHAQNEQYSTTLFWVLEPPVSTMVTRLQKHIQAEVSWDLGGKFALNL